MLNHLVAVLPMIFLFVAVGAFLYHLFTGDKKSKKIDALIAEAKKNKQNP